MVCLDIAGSRLPCAYGNSGNLNFMAVNFIYKYKNNVYISFAFLEFFR